MKTFGIATLGVVLSFVAGPAASAIITIGSFTQTMTTIDFDSFAAGPTSLGAIQAAAPSAGISDISLNCLGPNSTGVYDSNLAGDGLACSSSGGLEIYPQGARFFDMDQITVELDHLVTEIGFQHGDRTGTGSSISLFSGNALVGTFSPGSFQNSLLRLQSSVAFDKFVFSENENWLVTELVLQSKEPGRPVPAPATLALIGVGLLGLRLRRKD